MSGLKKILVHTDSRLDAHATLETAIELAKPAGATLMIADVVPEISWPARMFSSNADQIVEQMRQKKEANLQRLSVQANQAGVEASTILLDSPTSMSLMEEAIKGKYDLLIKERKGQVSRMPGVFGTTATRLLRTCPCPVLLLAPKTKLTGELIVAAVDAAAEDDAHAHLNRHIVDLAKSMRSEGGKVAVVHAWTLYGESILKEHMNHEEFTQVRDKAKQHAETELASICDKLSISEPDYHEILHGDAGDVIPAYTEHKNANLLVMGTVARTGLSGLLMGNTAERILDKVNCAVLAVKPAEFKNSISN